LYTTPASHFPGNTSVSLHFDDNAGVVEGDQYFTYHPELSLEEPHPSRGFVTGGTVITIRGTGLLNVSTLSCQFGNNTVTAKFISSNSMECLSPQTNQAQDVELGVSLNGVDFSGLTQG
jgi:IPT/TIG domain